MKSFNYFILLIIFLLIISCSKDNPSSNSNGNLNNLSCVVSGDLNFNFNAHTVSYIKYQTGQTLMFANMELNPNEIYSIQVNFNDSLNKYDFDLSGSEPLTYFEKTNKLSKSISYCSNITGNLSFTNKSADSLTGRLNFTASFIDTVNSSIKTIHISEGKFSIKKIIE